jgi:hypothetical protein
MTAKLLDFCLTTGLIHWEIAGDVTSVVGRMVCNKSVGSLTGLYPRVVFIVVLVTVCMLVSVAGVVRVT